MGRAGLIVAALTTSAAWGWDIGAQAVPRVAQRPVSVGDARWTTGFWADRVELCHQVIIPKMREAMEDDRNGAILGNFRVGAGLEEGKHRGTNWSDGDCYKWLEAQAWLYAVTRDPDLGRQMDYWIDLIAQAPAAATSLKLRIPGWADSASIAINGKAIQGKAIPGTYAAIERTWKDGDTVALDLPMRAVLVESDPRVEETWGQAAVMRGPLVYCAEAVDLPKGVSLWDVRLRCDATWTERHEPNLLGGVTVLETEALAAPEPESSGGLLRRVPKGAARPIHLKLIPYYAWNNRDETEMTVWLPLR